MKIEHSGLRDAKGRYAAGHGPTGGERTNREKARMRRELAGEYVDAVSAVLTPEVVAELLQKMIAAGDKYQSGRIYRDALVLGLSYLVGKPVQRMQVEEVASPEDWAAAFADKSTDVPEETLKEGQDEWLALLQKQLKETEFYEEGQMPPQ